MFRDLTVNVAVLRLVALLIIAPLQRLAVAAAAVALGDPGPRYDGELKLDPIRHLDVFGSLTTIIFGIGWSKPVAIDPAKLRFGRATILLVILSAFAALLAIAFVLRLLVSPAITMLPDTAGITISSFLRLAAEIDLWFALVSLVPIPPLTAGLLLAAFGVRVSRPALWILAAALAVAVAFDFVRQPLVPAYNLLTSLVIGE